MPGESNKPSGATEEDLVNALQEMADGSVLVGGTQPATDNAGGEDERLGGSHEDAADEAAISQGRTEEEREEIRARRREERHQRKQRAREREVVLREELSARDRMIAELQDRIAAQEGRSRQGELAQLDAALQRAAQDVTNYKSLVAAAVSRNDGPGAAEATERMLRSQQRAAELTQLRQNYTAQQAAPQQALDPLLVSHAQSFMQRHPWYDLQGRDPDSRVLQAVDGALAQEGFNPTTATYWEELERRAATYLPHRMGAGVARGNKSGYTGADSPASERPAGRSVVAGSGRDSSSAGSYGSGAGQSQEAGYRLSSERVQALKDAGMWDDPKARAEAIKSYREYDSAQAKQSRR